MPVQSKTKPYVSFNDLAESQQREVSDEVRLYLGERDLTLDQWIEMHPERCGLPENRLQIRRETAAASEGEGGAENGA